MGDPVFEGVSEVDVHTPNIARIYDYFLGGSADFAADRQAGDEFLAVFPRNIAWSRIHRSFLGRAVRYLCLEQGVDQFLDLGSGVPTVGNVHESAQAHNPSARAIYADMSEQDALSSNGYPGVGMLPARRGRLIRPQRAHWRVAPSGA